MAKTKSTKDSVKITFGKRRCGKHKKRQGPKDKKVSVYRAQGRV